MMWQVIPPQKMFFESFRFKRNRKTYFKLNFTDLQFRIINAAHRTTRRVRSRLKWRLNKIFNPNPRCVIIK
jgi:hypothetical protein